MASALEVRVAAERYARMAPRLDERSRRLLIASEALALGPRSKAALSRATGVSPSLLARGIRELLSPETLPAGRIRKIGGGRKKAIDKDPTLLTDLEAWWNRAVVATRCHPCAGRARARPSWPRS